MYFKSKDEQGYITMIEGVQRKTLLYGQKTLMSEFILKQGASLPLHKHPQEQTGYLVSGKILLVIAGEQYEVNPGDSWVIPGDVEHSAVILEDAVAVEVFSPVREDFLP